MQSWRFALAVAVVGGWIFAGGSGCPPVAPSGSQDDAAVVVTLDEAQASLQGALSRFVIEDDPAAAATELDEAAAQLFAASDDVDELIDASIATLTQTVDTPEQYDRLMDQSIPMAGRSGGTVETGGVAEPAARLAAACGDGSPTVVVFINGVNNSYQEFKSSQMALAKLIENNPKPITVDGFYNVSGKDRERALFGGYLCPFFCFFVEATNPLSLVVDVGEFCQNVCAGVGALVGDGAQTILQKFQELVQYAPISSEAAAFGQFVKHYVDQGFTVIVVCHSQGNLMTQQALDSIKAADGMFDPATDSVGVIAVASPTSASAPFASFEGNTVRLTIENELVTLVPGTIEPNVPDQTGLSGLSAVVARHSFNDSYLKNTVARQAIIDAVDRMSCDLFNARGKIAFEGVVTAADNAEPLAGATVTVRLRDRTETMTTDANGEFRGLTINSYSEVKPFDVVITYKESETVFDNNTLTEAEIAAARAHREYVLVVDREEFTDGGDDGTGGDDAVDGSDDATDDATECSTIRFATSVHSDTIRLVVPELEVDQTLGFLGQTERLEMCGPATVQVLDEAGRRVGEFDVPYSAVDVDLIETPLVFIVYQADGDAQVGARVEYLSLEAVDLTP